MHWPWPGTCRFYPPCLQQMEVPECPTGSHHHQHEEATVECNLMSKISRRRCMTGRVRTYQKMASFIGSHIMQFCHNPIKTNKEAFSSFICNGHLHPIPSSQLARIKTQSWLCVWTQTPMKVNAVWTNWTYISLQNTNSISIITIQTCESETVRWSFLVQLEQET